MKNRILPIIAACLSLLLVGVWSVAAPAPQAGQPKEIVSVKAQRFYIEALAFSPDGKILASGAREGNLKLWDVASGKNRADIQACREGERGAIGIVCGLAFSLDGKTVATSGDDRKVKLWDVATGNNTDTYVGSVGSHLLFSPDGKTLICGYRQIDLARKKGRPLVEKIEGRLEAAAFDAKGKLLVATAAGGPEPPCVLLWDAETGKKTVTCKGHDESLLRIAFSSDVKTVASSSFDKTVRLWEAATGKNLASFDKLPIWSYCLLFSPDGKVLAVTGKESLSTNRGPGLIYLLGVPSGKILATLKGHANLVNCLAFSPNGRLLASGSRDGVIKIWQLPRRYKAE